MLGRTRWRRDKGHVSDTADERAVHYGGPVSGGFSLVRGASGDADAEPGCAGEEGGVSAELVCAGAGVRAFPVRVHDGADADLFWDAGERGDAHAGGGGDAAGGAGGGGEPDGGDREDALLAVAGAIRVRHVRRLGGGAAVAIGER